MEDVLEAMGLGLSADTRHGMTDMTDQMGSIRVVTNDSGRDAEDSQDDVEEGMLEDSWVSAMLAAARRGGQTLELNG